MTIVLTSEISSPFIVSRREKSSFAWTEEFTAKISANVKNGNNMHSMMFLIIMFMLIIHHLFEPQRERKMILARFIFVICLNRHRDVCPAMRMITLYRSRFLSVMQDEIFRLMSGAPLVGAE
jgi:hypothetical protein